MERTTVEQMIDKMMAERRKADRETKLTWNPDKPPLAPQDRVVGEVNLSLPYMKLTGERPGQYFFIQNARLFESNGRETTIEEIAKKVSDVTLHYIMESMKFFMKDAVSRDSSICTVCNKFRAESYDQYASHIINEHPSAVMEKLGMKQEEAPVPPPPVKIEEKPAGLTCCGKTFKNKQAIGAHVRFGHKAG